MIVVKEDYSELTVDEMDALIKQARTRLKRVKRADSFAKTLEHLDTLKVVRAHKARPERMYVL